MKIAVSFLSSEKIEKDIKKISLTDADYLHVDVIDGKFIKGRVIPFRKLKNIYRYTSKRLDVHLMVEKPRKYIKKFATMNTEYITIHVELNKNIEKNLQLIHNYGIKNGLAINHNTDISILRPYLDKIDMILVMSIVPGYGGQPFIEEAVDKLNAIRKMIDTQSRPITLSIDGGIDDINAKRLQNTDILTAGSFITNSNDYQAQIDKLRNVNKL